MKKAILSAFFIMLTASVALPVWGAKVKYYDLQLSQTADASGIHLKPGDYKIAVEGSTLLFFHDNQQIGKVPVQTEQASKKNPETSVSFNQNDITEICPGGTTMKLELGGSQ